MQAGVSLKEAGLGGGGSAIGSHLTDVSPAPSIFWDMKVDILTLILQYNMATFVTSLYFLCMIISEIGDSEKSLRFQ